MKGWVQSYECLSSETENKRLLLSSYLNNIIFFCSLLPRFSFSSPLSVADTFIWFLKWLRTYCKNKIWSIITRPRSTWSPMLPQIHTHTQMKVLNKFWLQWHPWETFKPFPFQTTFSKMTSFYYQGEAGDCVWFLMIILWYRADVSNIEPLLKQSWAKLNKIAESIFMTDKFLFQSMVCRIYSSIVLFTLQGLLVFLL